MIIKVKGKTAPHWPIQALSLVASGPTLMAHCHLIISVKTLSPNKVTL